MPPILETRATGVLKRLDRFDDDIGITRDRLGKPAARRFHGQTAMPKSARGARETRKTPDF